jgi:hypothetical protein
MKDKLYEAIQQYRDGAITFSEFVLKAIRFVAADDQVIQQILNENEE